MLDLLQEHNKLLYFVLYEIETCICRDIFEVIYLPFIFHIEKHNRYHIHLLLYLPVVFTQNEKYALCDICHLGRDSFTGLWRVLSGGRREKVKKNMPVALEIYPRPFIIYRKVRPPSAINRATMTLQPH